MEIIRLVLEPGESDIRKPWEMIRKRGNEKCTQILQTAAGRGRLDTVVEDLVCSLRNVVPACFI